MIPIAMAFVGSTMTPLQADRGPGEPIIASLRPGTRVEILRGTDGWTWVTVPERPAEHPLMGWLPSDRLVAVPVAAAENPPGALSLAVCTGGRADLLASWTPHAGFVDHQGAEWEAGPDPALEELGRTLAVLPWRIGLEVLPGTPFATPFMRSDWNDTSTPFAAASCDDMCGHQRVVLGPCEADGDVIATHALEPLSAADVPFTEERTPILVPAASDAELVPGEKLGLRRTDGVVVFSMGQADSNNVPMAKGPTRWFRTLLDGEEVILAVIPAAYAANIRVVTLLVVRSDERVESLDVKVDGQGC